MLKGYQVSAVFLVEVFCLLEPQSSSVYVWLVLHLEKKCFPHANLYWEVWALKNLCQWYKKNKMQVQTSFLGSFSFFSYLEFGIVHLVAFV